MSFPRFPDQTSLGVQNVGMRAQAIDWPISCWLGCGWGGLRLVETEIDTEGARSFTFRARCAAGR
jgi:hypothetical protein